MTKELTSREFTLRRMKKELIRIKVLESMTNMYCGSTADAFISLGVKNIELAIEWEERIIGDNKSK